MEILEIVGKYEILRFTFLQTQVGHYL